MPEACLGKDDLKRSVNEIKRQNHSIAIELPIELPIDCGVGYLCILIRAVPGDRAASAHCPPNNKLCAEACRISQLSVHW